MRIVRRVNRIRQANVNEHTDGIYEEPMVDSRFCPKVGVLTTPQRHGLKMQSISSYESASNCERYHFYTIWKVQDNKDDSKIFALCR